MTDAGMNEEAAIPREAAWPPEVVELVKAVRKVKRAHNTGRFEPLQVAIEAMDAALTPFKEIGND